MNASSLGDISRIDRLAKIKTDKASRIFSLAVLVRDIMLLLLGTARLIAVYAFSLANRRLTYVSFRSSPG